MVDRKSAISLAASVAGLENHDERIATDREYAYRVTKSSKLTLEYHAILAIADRLQILIDDVRPPVTLDARDIDDGAFRPPFRMERSYAVTLRSFMRECLAKSPVAKIAITAERNMILYAFIYNPRLRSTELVEWQNSDLVSSDQGFEEQRIVPVGG